MTSKKDDEEVLKTELTRFHADLHKARVVLADIRKEFYEFDHQFHNTAKAAYRAFAFQILIKRLEIARDQEERIEREIANAMATYKDLAKIFG